MAENKKDPFQSLHVVVPLSKQESLWRDLLNDLVSLPRGSKVTLVGEQNLKPSDFEEIQKRSLFDLNFEAEAGSVAVALNKVAFSSRSEFIWFLHADSKIPKSTLAQLQKSLDREPKNIHYCQLQFLDDGPGLMFINSLAVQLRSKLLNLSFGHQGLALARRTFEFVGGFNEDLASDTVQDFLWRAKGKRIHLSRVESPIYTSARYYKNQGWSRASISRFTRETKNLFTFGANYWLTR